MELAPDGVRVALVEPGAIATEIWRKGTADADVLEAQFSEQQRARYATRVAAGRRASDRAARHAVPPERVAKAIVHALTARRPRGRYVIGPDAHVEAAMAVLPSGLLDRAIGAVTGMPRR
jgi:NAD(P)-dependent dehydrogenase (short-subunit alcohol dehydrogenase family)